MSKTRTAKAQKRMSYQPMENNTINFNQVLKEKSRPVELLPKSLNQENLVLNLLDPLQHIVIAVGPAGTGKTYLAMQAAIKAFRAGDCDRIILTRPAVGVEGEQHGFLPGGIIDKMEPWTRPLLDVLREYYHPKTIEQMLVDQTIEISPLAYMRGRTFKNSWIVADEIQNATPLQVKMLLTRIGVNSKIIVTGDIEQADRVGDQNGLFDLCVRLEKQSVNGISVCKFTDRDIQRHKIISGVLKLYNQ